MIKKPNIASDTIASEVVTMDEANVILQNLPTSVRGFVFLGDDGDPVIVLNARLTREQNRLTFDHERGHIDRGEMTDTTYNEYGGENDEFT